MKFTSIERASCAQFRDTVMPELQKVLAKFGLAATTEGAMKYMPGVSMDVKLKLIVIGNGEDSAAALAEAARADYVRRAAHAGINPETFGKFVMLRGTRYEIKGFVSAGSSKIRLAREYDGKTFSYNTDVLDRYLVK
jgi:hypothetical protein